MEIENKIEGERNRERVWIIKQGWETCWERYGNRIDRIQFLSQGITPWSSPVNSPFGGITAYKMLLQAELCFPTSYVEFLTHSTSECDCIRDKVFKEVMRVLGWALIKYDWSPYKKRLEHRHAQRDNHVKTKRNDSHLQSKERRPQKKPIQGLLWRSSG